MKVTRLGDAPPILNSGFGYTSQLPNPIGTAGQVVTSNGSNGAYWGENVARISANGSNALVGPFVSIAAGSNIILSTSSNELRIHSTSGGASISAGSNSTAVRELSTAGASTTLWSPFDHAHEGVSAVTASSSNTMQRGTWNLRPGQGIALALSDTDGDGEFDTTTIVNTAAGVIIPGGQGGGLVLLEQHTASSSATLDFTTFISSTYDDYLFELLGILPDTNDVAFRMRMGTGAGPTYDTGNNYGWGVFIHRGGGSGLNGADTGQAFISLVYQAGGTLGLSSTTTYGWSGRIRLSSPQSTALYKAIKGEGYYWDAEVFGLGVSVSGAYLSTTALTALRFYMSSGNIASGTIRVYGVAKT